MRQKKRPRLQSAQLNINAALQGSPPQSYPVVHACVAKVGAASTDAFKPQGDTELKLQLKGKAPSESSQGASIRMLHLKIC